MKLTFTTIIATISVLIQGTIGAAATTDTTLPRPPPPLTSATTTPESILFVKYGDGDQCIAELIKESTDKNKANLKILYKPNKLKKPNNADKFALFEANKIASSEAEIFVASICPKSNFEGSGQDEYNKIINHISSNPT